jgi:hypothetical protein
MTWPHSSDIRTLLPAVNMVALSSRTASMILQPSNGLLRASLPHQENTMFKTIPMKLFVLIGALTLAAAYAQVALAQSAEPSPSRATVKAETRAAAKAHQLAPAGEAADFPKPTKSTSNKTRTERKTETLQARKDGKLQPAGDAVDERAVAKLPPSTKTRAERKAETLAAAKARQLTPAGEGSPAPSK